RHAQLRGGGVVVTRRVGKGGARHIDGGGGGAASRRREVGGVAGAAAGEVAQRAAGDGDVAAGKVSGGLAQGEAQVRYIADLQGAVIGADQNRRRRLVNCQVLRGRRRRITGGIRDVSGDRVATIEEHWRCGIRRVDVKRPRIVGHCREERFYHHV